MFQELEKLFKEYGQNLRSMLKSFGIQGSPIVPEVIKLPNFQAGEDLYKNISSQVQEDLIYEVEKEITNLPTEIHFDATNLILQGKLQKVQETRKYLLFIQGYETEDKKNVQKQYFLYFTVLPDPWDLWKVKDTSVEYPDAPYKKPDSDQNEISEKMGSCIAASLRGRSHAHDGWFREDDFAMDYDEDNQVFILAVSDGAGSYRHSRKGSEIVCRKSITITKETLRKKGPGEGLFLDVQKYITGERSTEDMKKSVARVLGAKSALGAYFAMAKQAKIDGFPIRATQKNRGKDGYKNDGYAATLLLAAIFCVEKKWCVATFWIGDGAMVAINGNEVTRIGEAEHGVDVSATNFITHLDWTSKDIGSDLVQRSNFYCFDELEQIILMTDGVSDPWLGDIFDNPEDWKILRKELSQHLEKPPTEGAKSLCDWLNFRKKGSHDDRTIIICSLQDGFQKNPHERTFEEETEQKETVKEKTDEVEEAQPVEVSQGEANDIQNKVVKPHDLTEAPSSPDSVATSNSVLPEQKIDSGSDTMEISTNTPDLRPPIKGVYANEARTQSNKKRFTSMSDVIKRQNIKDEDSDSEET